ncbi:MAG: heterodisulfide reductase-related iron-sulfur binding cluster, partial [Acidobacteriota bacterium]|nr:heterodisulfide reductase-related iron-sulfur binding cluster [Acidobacteriota bacterium]
EAAWGCTTCGACLEVCPTQDEQMLDIIDIRRHQVMIEGEFPAQLQSAFRGMERNGNPWGINHEQRLAWADGLQVPTTDENPEPDVLYWVGCAASYDPQAQKTARAFVELLQHAGVNFAVLGKKECCTGDSARRAGNEYLYRQLADKNVATLNTVRPKLVVASCPHCLNTVGHEYKQIGGDYKVLHHTEYLEGLVASGKLTATPGEATVTYHDPCYLGRHNGIYEAPRNLLHVLSNATPELPRNRENAFCCGAGGAQFWKEEEPGEQRISDNRFREAQGTLAGAAGEKVLAVGCPFCKSMLGSTPGKADAEEIAIKDVAELLLEGVRRSKGLGAGVGADSHAVLRPQVGSQAGAASAAVAILEGPGEPVQPAISPAVAILDGPAETVQPPTSAVAGADASSAVDAPALPSGTPERKKWKPKGVASAGVVQSAAGQVPVAASEVPESVGTEPGVPESAAVPVPSQERKKWKPKAAVGSGTASAAGSAPEAHQGDAAGLQGAVAGEPDEAPPAPARKKWTPKKPE